MPGVTLESGVHRKALWFRTGFYRFSVLVFSTTERVPKLRIYFRKGLDQVYSQNTRNTLFGIGNLPVVDKSSDEKRSHLSSEPKPKFFTVVPACLCKAKEDIIVVSPMEHPL